jgi:hypothetical protein
MPVTPYPRYRAKQFFPLFEFRSQEFRNILPGFMVSALIHAASVARPAVAPYPQSAMIRGKMIPRLASISGLKGKFHELFAFFGGDLT